MYWWSPFFTDMQISSYATSEVVSIKNRNIDNWDDWVCKPRGRWKYWKTEVGVCMKYG